MITGLNHLTFAVQDVDESFHFYTAVLGCRAVAKWPKGVYLLAGDIWLTLVLDDQARNQPLPEYTHIAFTVTPADFDRMCEQIRQLGAPIWQANWTEGASLYFTDPNGHKLEIHASDLAARLQSAREQPWEGLKFFDIAPQKPYAVG